MRVPSCWAAYGLSRQQFVELCDEFGGLDKVVVRSCRRADERTGQQVSPEVVELHEHIHRDGHGRSAGAGRGRRAVQTHTQRPSMFASGHGTRVTAVSVVDVNIRSAVEQFRAASRAGTIVTFEHVRSRAFDFHFRDAHQIPDIDDDLRMTNQECVQFWIAFDGLRRQATKEAGTIDDTADVFASGARDAREWNAIDCIGLSCRARGRILHPSSAALRERPNPNAEIRSPNSRLIRISWLTRLAQNSPPLVGSKGFILCERQLNPCHRASLVELPSRFARIGKR